MSSSMYASTFPADAHAALLQQLFMAAFSEFITEMQHYKTRQKITEMSSNIYTESYEHSETLFKDSARRVIRYCS